MPTQRVGKKCRTCYQGAQKRAREEQPERAIAQRLRKWCNKHEVHKKTLWCEPSVNYVLERWERKCAITGEADLTKLTIVSFCPPRADLEQDDLVLVSSHAAIQVGRAKDRELAFPNAVRQRFAADAHQGE